MTTSVNSTAHDSGVAGRMAAPPVSATLLAANSNSEPAAAFGVHEAASNATTSGTYAEIDNF